MLHRSCLKNTNLYSTTNRIYLFFEFVDNLYLFKKLLKFTHLKDLILISNKFCALYKLDTMAYDLHIHTYIFLNKF